MKYMSRREFDVQVESIVYADELATLFLSRNGRAFEIITERSNAQTLQPYIGSEILLAVEAWLEFSWSPIGEG